MHQLYSKRKRYILKSILIKRRKIIFLDSCYLNWISKYLTSRRIKLIIFYFKLIVFKEINSNFYQLVPNKNFQEYYHNWYHNSHNWYQIVYFCLKFYCIIFWQKKYILCLKSEFLWLYSCYYIIWDKLLWYIFEWSTLISEKKYLQDYIVQKFYLKSPSTFNWNWEVFLYSYFWEKGRSLGPNL